jgi:hypothetical protein
VRRRVHPRQELLTQQHCRFFHSQAALDEDRRVVEAVIAREAEHHAAERTLDVVDLVAVSAGVPDLTAAAEGSAPKAPSSIQLSAVSDQLRSGICNR